MYPIGRSVVPDRNEMTDERKGDIKDTVTLSETGKPGKESSMVEEKLASDHQPCERMHYNH